MIDKFKEELKNDINISSSRLTGDNLLSGLLLGFMSGSGALRGGFGSYFAIKASNLIAEGDYLNAALNVFYGYTFLRNNMGKDNNFNANFNGGFNNSFDYNARYNQALMNASNAGAMGYYCPRFNNENDFVNYWCPRATNGGYNGGYNANMGFDSAFIQNNSLFKKINKGIDSLICQLPFVSMADRGTIRMIKGILIGAFIFYLLNNEKSQEFIFSNIIKGSALLQGFFEEIKEKFEDIKAEIEEAKEQSDEE